MLPTTLLTAKSLAFHPSLDPSTFAMYEKANIIILPSSILQATMNETNLPRFFKVRNEAQPFQSVNVAVLEYSAVEGTAYLPHHLFQQCVPILEQNKILVTPFWPHSAMYAKFQFVKHQHCRPLTMDEYEQALIQTFRTRYPILSLGDELVLTTPPDLVSFYGEEIRFCLVHVEPDVVVTTVDTDMSIDVEQLEREEEEAPAAQAEPDVMGPEQSAQTTEGAEQPPEAKPMTGANSFLNSLYRERQERQKQKTRTKNV
jgi:hypothetical protein